MGIVGECAFTLGAEHEIIAVIVGEQAVVHGSECLERVGRLGEEATLVGEFGQEDSAGAGIYTGNHRESQTKVLVVAEHRENGDLSFGENGGEHLGEPFTAAEATVFETGDDDVGLEDGSAVGFVDVLLEDKFGATALEVETADERVVGAERGQIVGIDVGEDGVDALTVHLGESDADLAAKLVASVLEIMEIVGIIYNALVVKLVVANLHINVERIVR